MLKLFKRVTSFFKKKLIKNVDVHGFEYTVRELVGMYENSQKAIQWHGEILGDQILTYKKSDTVFILGSGPSINLISDTQWEVIKKNDSIGFNFSFVHDFVPSLYVYQHEESLLKAFKQEFHKYKGVPVLWRGSQFAQGKYELDKYEFLKQSPLFYLNEYPISSKFGVDIDFLFRYLKYLNLMPRGSIAPFIPKLRSTVGMLAMLCYQMGYKKIVLCGVDMDGNDHFWDHIKYQKKKQQYFFHFLLH
jgi:hypothetical protein